MGGVKIPLMPWKECNIQYREGVVANEEVVELLVVQSEKKEQQHQHQKRFATFSCQPSSTTSDDPNKVTPKIKTAPSCFRSNRRSKQGRSSISLFADAAKPTAPRKVHFNEVAKVMWIENINDMSVEELDASYYTPQDYLDIREREKNLFRQLSNWGTIQSTADDIMGLECRAQRYNRKGRSRDSIYAVVLEQEMNRNPETGVCDDVTLCQIYQPYTIEATRMASDRALKNSMQVGTAPSQQERSNRFFPMCAPMTFMADEKMERTYQELKQTVDTTVGKDVYTGVIKYAIACIPPSPASLRLGHDPLLAMAQPEDEKPWSDGHECPEEKQEEGCTEVAYDYFGEEKKLHSPLRQEMERSSINPQPTHCDQKHNYHPMNPRPINQEDRYAQWMAQRRNFPPSAFTALPPQQRLHGKHNRPTPRPPMSEWTLTPVVWDFAPVPPTRMIAWNIY
jgi:hypothetical protein